MSDTRECSECQKTKDAGEFTWTHDRYGIPYRKVCWDCSGKVEAEVQGWVFDAADAGEHLEPDY